MARRRVSVLSRPLHPTRLIPFLLLTLLVTAGCRRKTDVERANEAGILLVGNGAEPRSLDLQLVTGVPENKIISSIFEGLIANHPSEDDTMVAGVASRWEHNENMTRWVFHLRPEAVWSDGHPLTAEDFIFSYHRMLNPVLAAAYAPMLHPIVNAEAYNRDERGYILCGLDDQFPVPWEVLRHANFSGKKRGPGTSAPTGQHFTNLGTAEKRNVLEHTGLDRMNSTHLRAILAEPALFDWPENIPTEARSLVLRRLLDHIEAGEPDLFQRAKLGLEAPDPHTLVVTLREPVPFLPSMTRNSTWFPVPRHVIEQSGHVTDRFNNWAVKGKLVGNGPFKLKEWRYNHYIEVERNPRYWDAANVGLNGIRFLPIDNAYTETRTFLAGQLHTTASLPAELLTKVRRTHPEFLRTEPYVGTNFLRFNVTRKGLDNPLVRRAVSLAINRSELCEHIYEGYFPAKTFTPKLGEYAAPEVLRYDLEEAKALLAEAGHPAGKGLGPYAILTSRPHPAADAMQQVFRTLGIRVTIEQKDWGSYIAAQQSLNFDMSLAGWIGDYLDATTFLDMWTKDNGNNNTGWDNRQYETLLREAAQQPDAVSRNATLAKAETILMEEMPIVPVAWVSRLYLHRPEVKGWHPLVLDNHPWKTITLSP